VVRRSPRLFGQALSRWTLAALAAAVLWLGGLTRSGVHRALGRLAIRYRRGQAHVHSPDLDYDAKLAAVARARADAEATPGRVVVLYQDEFTYYRRPLVGRAYAPRGGPGPPAEQGHTRNAKRRVIGSLNAQTGAGFYWQRPRADVPTLRCYYRALEAAYPEAELIYVAQDNWPVHFHAEVRKALAGSRIRLLRLPTYAPWTNPIEKVWRWLKEEVLYQHAFGDDWPALQREVAGWLERHAGGGPAVLRYVGLSPE
jgi:hypothetical protein